MENLDKIIKETLGGLDVLIKDKELCEWYKSLIKTIVLEREIQTVDKCIDLLKPEDSEKPIYESIKALVEYKNKIYDNTKRKSAKEFFKRMKENKKATPEQIAEIKKNADAVKKIMEKSAMFLQMTYKAYGAYLGSHADGGSTGIELYWSKDKAREKCLEHVADIDEQSQRMLKFSLKGAGKEKEVIEYYQNQYRPMEEIEENCWTNGMDRVKVIEFQIK